MTLTSGDIKIFMSGGVSNSDPDNCLGGDISNTYFTSVRLFDSVTAVQNAAGYVDYRCVYINNISSFDTLYDAQIFIGSEVSGGSSTMIGIEQNNERQDIYITNAAAVGSGNFTLRFYDYFTDNYLNFTVNHDLLILNWVSNFQTAIREIDGLGDVTVSGSYIGTTAYFTVNFVGSSQKRYFESLELVSLSQNFLNVNASLSIQKVTDGGPKLNAANEIPSEVTVPANVVFVSTSSTSTISIGDLRPTEYFAVWVKRTVISGVDSIEGDGFTIRVKGVVL
jgi:hypothetical protein